MFHVIRYLNVSRETFFYMEENMHTEIIIAIISFCGTCLGALQGSRLTIYRIKKLEEKVEKHNNFATRLPVVEEQIKDINYRLEGLENER